MEQVAIRTTIQAFSLDLKRLVGFSSDGCSTMLGKIGGVARKLQQFSPCMVPFHCPAHHLDLAIQDIAKEVCVVDIVTKFRIIRT